MQAGFYVLLFVLGAMMGSFLCCQARRLHLRVRRGKKLGKRSVCLHCHKQIKWYDNLPVVSWLMLRGKCRECGRPIGVAEMLSEVMLGVGMVMLGTTINVASASVLEWVMFVGVVVLTGILAFLAIYDGLYGEMPTVYLTLSIICGIIVLCIREVGILLEKGFSMSLVWEPLVAVMILGGLYLLLYLVSKGKWVGDGDYLLGTAIALALYSPWLALVNLFVANFLATIVMYPMVRGDRKKKIHFGPFLVAGFVVTYSLAELIMAFLG